MEHFNFRLSILLLIQIIFLNNYPFYNFHFGIAFLFFRYVPLLFRTMLLIPLKSLSPGSGLVYISGLRRPQYYGHGVVRCYFNRRGSTKYTGVVLAIGGRKIYTLLLIYWQGGQKANMDFVYVEIHALGSIAKGKWNIFVLTERFLTRFCDYSLFSYRVFSELFPQLPVYWRNHGTSRTLIYKY